MVTHYSQCLSEVPVHLPPPRRGASAVSAHKDNASVDDDDRCPASQSLAFDFRFSTHRHLVPNHQLVDNRCLRMCERIDCEFMLKTNAIPIKLAFAINTNGPDNCHNISNFQYIIDILTILIISVQLRNFPTPST